MDKLLDCPFCGGRSQEVVSNDVAVVCCMSCFATASPEQWNTRHAPEGWQLVPVEANEEMLDEGCESRERGEELFGRNKCQIVNNIYEDMLAAAPKWGGE